MAENDYTLTLDGFKPTTGQQLCPTCGGKGTIADPTINGPMSYCDSKGNSWPQVLCRGCGGSGWVPRV